MYAALVGEGAAPHEGPGIERWDVGQFTDVIGEVGNVPKGLVGQAVPLHLQLQVGDDRDQIGVAATLAETVDRSLHHADAGPDRLDRIGHAEAAVVVCVNPHPLRRDERGNLGDGRRHLKGKRTPVGVAQDDHVRAGGQGGLDGFFRVDAVVLEAVEKMLRVVDDLPPVRLQVGDGIADHGQVLRERDVQDLPDMQVPGLSEDGHRRRFRPNDGGQVRAFFRQGVRLSRAAEGGEAGMPEAGLLGQFEEPCIFRIGAGPSPFDIMKARLVKPLGNPQFLLRGEVDLFSLGPVPERRVINQDAGFFHRRPLLVTK